VSPLRVGSHSGGTVQKPELDTTRPSIARAYDYWLYGKDNFAADRQMVDEMERCYPGARQMVVSNRQFLVRVVGWAASQGISQFLDLGAGLPTVENTHQTAKGRQPRCARLLRRQRPGGRTACERTAGRFFRHRRHPRRPDRSGGSAG
jgi:S-adenosyl methyltransferase